MWQDENESDQSERPGKTRTWWHPLLTRLLSHELSTAYSVQDEVLVGKLPLRVDILLIRREAGQLSEESQRHLDVLLPLLNRFTLIEFKGPTDTLRPGDLAQLFGCAFLWHGQQSQREPSDDISLIVLAPVANEAAKDELRSFGHQITPHEPGILSVVGAPFTTWLVETDEMARRGQPILSLVSRVFLQAHRSIIERLRATDHAALLSYILQQIQQFRSLGEDFAMQHTDSELLGQVEEELQAAVLQAIPVEKRLQGLSADEILQAISVEQRLRGLSAQERVSGLSPEELAAALSKEQIKRLWELIERNKQD
jgi:hypothetical protein